MKEYYSFVKIYFIWNLLRNKILLSWKVTKREKQFHMNYMYLFLKVIHTTIFCVKRDTESRSDRGALFESFLRHEGRKVRAGRARQEGD